MSALSSPLVPTSSQASTGSIVFVSGDKSNICQVAELDLMYALAGSSSSYDIWSIQEQEDRIKTNNAIRHPLIDLFDAGFIFPIRFFLH